MRCLKCRRRKAVTTTRPAPGQPPILCRTCFNEDWSRWTRDERVEFYRRLIEFDRRMQKAASGRTDG